MSTQIKPSPLGEKLSFEYERTFGGLTFETFRSAEKYGSSCVLLTCDSGREPSSLEENLVHRNRVTYVLRTCTIHLGGEITEANTITWWSNKFQ